MSRLSDLTHSFAHMMETCRGAIWDTRTDWSDVLAMKGARELLQDVKYPDDDTRRSLYASWLHVFASDLWQESFDHLMLECVVATPSPSNPEKPLYADIFKAHDPIDRPFADVGMPVLNPEMRPRLFSSSRGVVEPLPSLPGFAKFVADLLRKSRDSRAALNEAGLIIGFCSLALSTVVAKPADLREFLQTRVKSGLSATVPTSFEGDVHCPSESFLAQLIRRAHLMNSKVKPYIVLLVLGQYCFHVYAKDAQLGHELVLRLEAGGAGGARARPQAVETTGIRRSPRVCQGGGSTVGRQLQARLPRRGCKRIRQT